jgi:hypothetical protein
VVVVHGANLTVDSENATLFYVLYVVVVIHGANLTLDSESATLSCTPEIPTEYQADTTVSITWSRNGNPISGDRFTTQHSGELLQIADPGRYTLVVVAEA